MVLGAVLVQGEDMKRNPEMGETAIQPVPAQTADFISSSCRARQFKLDVFFVLVGIFAYSWVQVCIRTMVSHKWGERKSNGGLETKEGNRLRSTPPRQTQIAIPTRGKSLRCPHLHFAYR